MKLTSLQRKKSNANRVKAWMHFYPEGKGNGKPGYDLHHIDPRWRHEDIERYVSWNIEDLVMLPHDDHARLHQRNNDMSACHTPEAIEKMRQKQLGNKNAEGQHNISDEGRIKMGHWKGQKFSQETCKKMSLSRIGSNNPAFGKHWWNNGIVNLLCKDAPGDEWKQGKLSINRKG